MTMAQRIKEKLSVDKKLFITIVSILLMFTSLDLISTYIGVCVLKGEELNIDAILMASRYGYLVLSTSILIQNIILGYFFALMLKIFKNNEIMRILFLVMLAIFILDYSKIVAFNFNTLIFQISSVQLAKPERISDIPYEDLPEISEFFNAPGNRQDFCRLI